MIDGTSRGSDNLGVDAAKGIGDLAKQGVKRVSSDKYEKAKEMPSAEEPPPLPSAEEPQPTAPTRDDVEAAIAATNLKGFDRATEDKLAIKKIRDYLKTKSPRNAPSLTWAEYLGPEGRGKRGPTIDGREIPIVAAREIVAESKKSQKSLLKHLQSMSR